MVVCLCILVALGMLFMLFCIDADDCENPDELWIIRLIIIIPGCILYFLLASMSNRIFDYVLIDSKGITYKAPFKKKVTGEFKLYTHMYLGWYSHCGFPVLFVIFARHFIKDSVLSNANLIVSSKNIIKVRLTKRTYKKLISILPPNLIKRLNDQLRRIKVEF